MSEHEPARLHGKVRISYPVAPYRYGWVVQDDGGPKVKVRWYTQKEYVGGERGPRRILVANPRRHEQWFPRERIEQSS